VSTAAPRKGHRNSGTTYAPRTPPSALTGPLTCENMSTQTKRARRKTSRGAPAKDLKPFPAKSGRGGLPAVPVRKTRGREAATGGGVRSRSWSRAGTAPLAPLVRHVRFECWSRCIGTSARCTATVRRPACPAVTWSGVPRRRSGRRDAELVGVVVSTRSTWRSLGRGDRGRSGR